MGIFNFNVTSYQEPPDAFSLWDATSVVVITRMIADSTDPVVKARLQTKLNSYYAWVAVKVVSTGGGLL